MTTHAIQLTTRDGLRVDFPCEDNQDLLAAAAQGGILLPSLCRDGGCGACICTAEEGDYRLGEYNPAALPQDARDRGEVLLCRTYPQSDLALKAPYGGERIRYEAPTSRPAEIIDLAPVAERTMRLLLRLLPDRDGGQAAEFQAGQYMSLAVPGRALSRPYSLANTANWTGELEFFIRLHPEGAFSAYLEREAQVGQPLEVQGPAGDFVLREQSLRPRCFVGGGTGVAPLLSMLRHMAEFGEAQPARLYFGVNRETELFALDELERLGRELPQLKTTLCVWRPEDGWTGFRGTPVDALRHDLEQGGPAPDLYLCGPPLLATAATETARSFGIPDERIFSEKFLPSG